MEKEKKPFYKKWWFWLIVVVVLIAMFVPESDKEKTDEPTEKEINQQDEKETKPKEKVEKTEKEEKKQKDEPEQKEKEDKKKVKKDKKKETKRSIKVDQMLNTNNLELEVKSVTIEDGKIEIPIWWKQWNMYDEAHLSLVAHPVVEQGGEELKIVDGDSELLEQKKQLTPARASLEYELMNDEDDVTVRFLDIREEIRDEMITIDIKE